MRRLRVAVALGLVTSLAAVSVPPAARAGTVDITPPAVGSCHDLTFDEALSSSDPDPAIECSTRHTSLTLQVVDYEAPPDWREWDKISRRLWVPCNKALIERVGYADWVQKSAYRVTFFRPTKAQRDAGAAWVRCDAVVLAGPHSLGKVPGRHMGMGGLGPMDQVAKCRRGKRDDYAMVICTRPHEFFAQWTPGMRGDHYPGVRAAKKFAADKCMDLVGDPAGGDPFLYEWVPNRLYWRAGYRSAVCLRSVDDY